MIKVAMIGAGSVVFSKNLTGDILSYPELKDATLAYMDIDPERLSVGVGLCPFRCADATLSRLAALPHQVVHGDYHDANLFFDNGKATGVID